MAKEHAEEFHARLSTDADLRKAVRKTSEEVLSIAKRHNLHFTREELAQVMYDKWQSTEAGPPDENDPATSFVSERPSF